MLAADEVGLEFECRLGARVLSVGGEGPGPRDAEATELGGFPEPGQRRLTGPWTRMTPSLFSGIHLKQTPQGERKEAVASETISTDSTDITSIASIVFKLTSLNDGNNQVGLSGQSHKG